MMRKAIIAASVAALLIVLYGAAGYWLAPRYLHGALVERAARLGLALGLGEVRTHPFRLTATVQGVRLLAGGRELAQAERLEADLAWRSLWSGAWHVQHAALRAPRAAVELGPEGDLDWPAARSGSGGTGSGVGFVVEQVSISDGALRFVDRSRGAPVEVYFEAINAHASNLSTLAGERGAYELQARTAQGGRLGVEGGLTLEPLAAQGRLDLAGVPLATVWRLAAPASDPGSGEVQGSAGFTYDGGQLAFSDVVLEGSGLAYEGAKLPRLVLRSPRIPLPLREAIEMSGEAALPRQGRLSAAGTLGFGPFTAELQARAEGVPLEQANRWLPESVPVRIASGTAAAEGRVSLGPQGTRYEGALTLVEGRVEERQSGDLLAAWKRLQAPAIALESAPLRAQLGEVAVQSPEGRLALGGADRAGDADTNTAPMSLSLERLIVENGALEIVTPELQAAVRGIDGEVRDFDTADNAPAHVELRAARVVLPEADPVPVSASGRVALQPFAADLQLKADGLPLPLAERWLPEAVAIDIVSGRLAAEGRLRLGEAGARFDGALAARDARIEERGSGDLLLAWQSLSTEQASLAFAPFRAELGEVLARAPRGRLVIGEQGELNVAAVFKGSEESGGGPPPQMAVRRLRIEGGVLQFADRSLESEFAVTVAELGGTVSGFSTEPGDPARVQLKGRVGEYGAARIGGTVNLDAPSALTDIRASLRNLDLAELTPYVVRFAGYRVESGRVSAELRYRVRGGRLVGENDLTFEQLQLGEKVRRAGAADLPLELAVALLADAKGRISLDIPVSGNLNDPQFDFAGLVARALGNVVGKIVSAPFRVLAGVFGKGGEDLDRVAFAPGSAALSPPAEEAVANVAKALAERPRVNVTVQGGYDPQADLEALRRNAARRLVAARAGVAAEGPLDFGDPKVLQAAERLYLERVGNRLEMQALREAEPRYGRALLERLAQRLPAEEDSAQKLARARAEMVRAGLLSHGVDPSRVRLEAPESRDAAKEGVPTVLAVDTGGAAAAGGTR